MLQIKAARLILDLPAHSSATEVLKRLGWKPLLRHRKEYRTIFMYKLPLSTISHSIVIFIVTIQDPREMTVVNPVPKEDGVTGRQ